MSKDKLYVEVIGGSLARCRERQIANIYDHRGNSICDQMWLGDAEMLVHRFNAWDDPKALRARLAELEALK